MSSSSTAPAASAATTNESTVVQEEEKQEAGEGKEEEAAEPARKTTPKWKAREREPSSRAVTSPAWDYCYLPADDHPVKGAGVPGATSGSVTRARVAPGRKQPFMALVKTTGKNYYGTNKALRHLQSAHETAVREEEKQLVSVLCLVFMH